MAPRRVEKVDSQSMSLVGSTTMDTLAQLSQRIVDKSIDDLISGQGKFPQLKCKESPTTSSISSILIRNIQWLIFVVISTRSQSGMIQESSPYSVEVPDSISMEPSTTWTFLKIHLTGNTVKNSSDSGKNTEMSISGICSMRSTLSMQESSHRVIIDMSCVDSKSYVIPGNQNEHLTIRNDSDLPHFFSLPTKIVPKIERSSTRISTRESLLCF